MNDATQSNSRSKAAFPLKKLLILAFVVAVTAIALFQFKDDLSLQSLAAKETEFRDYQVNHPIMVYGIAFLIYVTVTGLSLPAGAALTLIIGWFFGFWEGLLIASFASTTGATLAFTISRYLLRDSIQSKFGERLEKFDEALKREGAFYLFSLRLIPVVPFFVINLVMGLTPIKTATFWWVSQIGMLAGTAVYVYAGSSVPSLQTFADNGIKGIISWQLLVAFIALGLFPITVKKIMSRFQKASA